MDLDLNKPAFFQKCSLGQNPLCHYKEFCSLCLSTYTHTIWTCTFCFSARNGMWMAVWRLWNGPETSVRKVFLLHLWPNSLQELQVSLCLLEQEEAPTRGGPGPGKQRSWRGRAACIQWTCAPNLYQCPLQTLFDAIGKSQVSWIELVAHLSVHWEDDPSTPTLYVLDIFALTFE